MCVYPSVDGCGKEGIESLNRRELDIGDIV